MLFKANSNRPMDILSSFNFSDIDFEASVFFLKKHIWHFNYCFIYHLFDSTLWNNVVIKMLQALGQVIERELITWKV